jgi:peptidyl-prolyl cis-trans isomerase A (cyclophilin A)
MRRLSAIALCAAAALALTGCSSSNEPPKTEETKKEVAPAPPKKEQAPDLYHVNLDTSKGPIVIEVHRDWAPIGADHLYALVKTGFYDGDRFYRYVRNFIVQWGINGDPKTNRLWANANLPDDPVKWSNVKGTVTYATAGPNTRSTQLFINLRNNAALDAQGFAPIGKVSSGMDVVERLYSSYGDMPDMGGQGPDPGKIETQGNEYLEAHFPRLDYIKKATIE